MRFSDVTCYTLFPYYVSQASLRNLFVGCGTLHVVCEVSTSGLNNARLGPNSCVFSYLPHTQFIRAWHCVYLLGVSPYLSDNTARRRAWPSYLRPRERDVINSRATNISWMHFANFLPGNLLVIVSARFVCGEKISVDLLMLIRNTILTVILSCFNICSLVST